MPDSPPRRCGLAHCTSGLPARLYPAGWLCLHCCPSAQAGEPHPDEVTARYRALLAAAKAGAS